MSDGPKVVAAVPVSRELDPAMPQASRKIVGSTNVADDGVKVGRVEVYIGGALGVVLVNELKEVIGHYYINPADVFEAIRAAHRAMEVSNG